MFFGLDLIIPALSYVIKNVAFWFMFLALKKYIVIGIIAGLIFLGLMMLEKFLNVIKLIVGSAIGRYCLIGLIGIGLGLGVSKCSHVPLIGASASEKVKEHSVRLNEEKIRSADGAITFKGKTYYKASLINEYLKKIGKVARFSPTLDR